MSSPLLTSPLLYYPILSYPILSYPILSYPILSYPILSYPILSYLILSYPILSYPLRTVFLLYISSSFSGDDPDNAAQSVSLREDVAVSLSQQLDKTCHIRIRNTSITTGAPWNSNFDFSMVSGFIPGQGSGSFLMNVRNMNLGSGSMLNSFHSLPRLMSAREMEADNGRLNLTIILGNPGTGKSTAADYFKQGAKKRNLRIVSVQACEMDSSVRYGVLSKIFFRLLDPLNRCEGDINCQIELIENLLKKLPVTAGNDIHSSKKFLFRILQLEGSSSGGRSRGYSNLSGEAFTTVLDRRMSVTKINKSTRGTYDPIFFRKEKSN